MFCESVILMPPMPLQNFAANEDVPMYVVQYQIDSLCLGSGKII